MKLEEVFYIKEKDWYQLQGWATIAYEEDKNEISGLMTAVPQEDGRFKLGDVRILKQKNSGTNTELDADAVAEYTMKFGMKYNNPNMKFVWWHSHHTMGAFWSGTDENEIDEWKNNSFSLALVINLKEEYKFRVSVWNNNGLPIEEHFDTTLTIERPQPKVKITDAMKVEYENLCSNLHQPVVGNASIWGGHWGYNRINTNPRQLTLGQEKELTYEKEYANAYELLEGLQDDFVSGTIKAKDYKKEIKSFNKKCSDKKLPFKAKVIKGNGLKIMNKLMTLMPNELFEWDDNRVKDAYEEREFQRNYGGYTEWL